MKYAIIELIAVYPVDEEVYDECKQDEPCTFV